MKAFYCDHFVLPLPEGHRFPMAKYRLLREHVLAEGILSPSDLVEPHAASWDDIGLVHTRAYIADVTAGTLPAAAQRRIGFPWSAGMVERSRRSVGGTIEAARHALIDGTAVNLAGGTHHAFADRGEGFCVFNDVAVAARALQRTGEIHRAIVVDCDVHQGNGTASVFQHDPSVFTFSIHGEKNFPFRKEVSDLDVTLPDGATDDEYLDALARHLPAVLVGQRPDIVFYVAGADPYEHDRFGRLAMTEHGLRERDRFVFSCCEAAGLPVAVSMGGGYAPDVTAVARIHANTVREAARVSRGASQAVP